MDARALWKRVLLATLAHLVLLALWPLVRVVYAPLFRTLAQFTLTLVDPLPGPIDVHFEPGSGGPLAEDVVNMDTIGSIKHRELEGEAASFGASSFFNAYYPTSVLLALFAAATPLAWRARRAPLTWALLLLHVFLAARCALAAYYCYSKCTIDGRPALDLSPSGVRALHLLWHFVWDEMLTNYLVPLGIWSLCVFAPRSSGEPRGARAA